MERAAKVLALRLGDTSASEVAPPVPTPGDPGRAKVVTGSQAGAGEASSRRGRGSLAWALAPDAVRLFGVRRGLASIRGSSAE
jgi:hypothetical protein